MRPAIIISCLVFAAVFTSCEKKNFPDLPTADPNVPVSYKTEIEPLFSSKCASSGCHNGAIAPNLLIGKSYAALLEGLYVDTLALKTDGTIDASASLLMQKLNSNMPPGSPLPKSDIDKVANWIIQGAKEN